MVLKKNAERIGIPPLQGQLLGPLLLQPITQERIWGATSLPSWYPQPTEGKTIGEIWLTAEACLTTIGEDPAQHTLGKLAALRPEMFAAASGFPLLVKVLLPHEKLSVQVHPNDIQALALGETRGKTECWYILSAEPDATVAVGFREDMSPSDIRQSIRQGTLEDKLLFLPVKTGDMVYVDAGTVHAIGPGVVILEIQQYSDITYRLYDYGRPRELHVDAGLAVTRTRSEAGLVIPVTMNGFTRLVSSPYFIVDRFTLARDISVSLENSASLQILVALGEGCLLRTSNEKALPLLPGRAAVLPAENVSYTLIATAKECDVIRILAEESL